ncbi:hypothetical protein D3C85_1524230 [compost metagenome]
MFLCLASLKRLANASKLIFDRSSAGGPCSRMACPVIEPSSKPLMLFITSEMSGGFGFSLVRIHSASVDIQATRLANSSADGSGLTAWYSVLTSLSCAKKSRRSESGEINSFIASAMLCKRSKPPTGVASISSNITP